MIKKLIVPVLIVTNCLSLTAVYLTTISFREFEWRVYAAEDDFLHKKAEMEEQMEQQRRKLGSEIELLREQLEKIKLQRLPVESRPTARMMRT